MSNQLLDIYHMAVNGPSTIDYMFYKEDSTKLRSRVPGIREMALVNVWFWQCENKWSGA